MKRIPSSKLKILTIVGIGIILLTSLFLLATRDAEQKPDPTQTQSQTEGSSQVTGNIESEQASIKQDRYMDYSEEAIKDGYESTILFFYASWCPECRGFDQAIKAGELPQGSQILKVDYDSSGSLRKKYGVTIQSTFVRVDSNGDKQATWTGYGKEKSVSEIFKNTR